MGPDVLLHYSKLRTTWDKWKEQSASCQMCRCCPESRQEHRGSNHPDQIVHTAVFKATNHTSVSCAQVGDWGESRVCCQSKRWCQNYCILTQSQPQKPKTVKYMRGKSLLGLKSWRGHQLWQVFGVHVWVYLCVCTSPLNKTLTWPAPTHYPQK